MSSWTNITPPSGSSNPPPRFLPAMTYYPSGHDVVLFGGYGELGSAPFAFYQDTWSFVNNRWSEVISNTSCTATTCPSPRAGAMLAYFGPENALVLFGGYVYSPSITYVPFDDTWLYSGGAWKNITATVGPAPSARFEGAMVWDSFDNEVLLFGGSLASGVTLGDTWTFNGTWHNISGSLSQAPYARAGAAISGSPSGWILLFGGEHNGTVLLDPDCGASTVAWWFYDGKWLPLDEPICINVVSPSALANTTYPPCGRVNAALGWSPKNSRFVLYGGYGPSIQNKSSCGGFYDFLNDTWTYADPPGGGFVWNPASDSGDPPARYEMGYASDFTDNYFEIFGGWDGTDGGLNATWRFYEVVHAQLTGPTDIETGSSLSFLLPFTVVGYGGTGNLSYTFALKGLKNGNALSGTGCANLTNGASSPLPYVGQVQLFCHPVPTSYNVYRLTVNVVDDDNVTDQARANWTFTVSPPEEMAIYSQYNGYFYSGVSFPVKFGVLAVVAGLPALNLTATLAGSSVSFAQRSGAKDWWDASVDTGTVPAGAQVLQATATFAGNWTLTATYTVNVVETPDWLVSVIHYPQVTQSVSSKGAGPYNESYSITEAFQWSLDQALGFNIKLPFVSGNVSLIPAIKVSLTATSSGNLSLSGTLSLTPPSINLGVAKIGISAAVTLKGTFTLGIVSGQITGVKWQSAVASITVTGKFGASVPIYGFNILGVQVGFTLDVEVDPSVTLGMILAPTTPGFEEFIPGIQVKIEQFVGSLSLPLSLAVTFGIGIASIGIGGTISVAVNLATSTGLYISAGWVNGTIFVQASFLWWSDQWNLASGTIYSWTDPPPAGPTVAASSSPSGMGVAYNNGSSTTWSPHARYYVSSAYDQNVWLASESLGPAVSDIYPFTELTAATGPDGAYLFYTHDNASRSVQDGLTFAGLDLNSSSNALAGIPPPSDPNYLLTSPKATTLADGDLYVLWDALPISEASAASPADVTLLELQGAEFHTRHHTWGPVHTWTSGGLAQSYLVDATGDTPTIAALVSDAFLLGPSTPERLLEFNLTTGAEIANSSVAGISTLVSVRGTLGQALVETVSGNYSWVTLTSGGATPIPYTSPIGGDLVSAELAQGSGSTAVLLYRAANRSLLALYDLSTDSLLATLGLGQDVFEAHALASGSTTYVFVRTSGGLEGWVETGGTFTNLSTFPEAGIVSFALVQYGSGILVYSLTNSGNSTEPILTLRFAEVGASIVPVGSPSPTSGSTSSSSSSMEYALYLGGAAVGVGLLLAVVARFLRPRPPSAGVPPGAHPGGDGSNPSTPATEASVPSPEGPGR